ncbi:hypothetical protein EYZ11_008507 [Aspergillus tanneri]|uniref:Uncharacterized protein n=1 Tax=Aspergillus tanneri TaxID=1220188 RepID=A0A4S3JCG5_9EURO|nr:uncharacterized protein ATNIH1004_002857 [Aspergillus tanneri]KAA8650176.1 hypothetical protein ATNIH1004_002857 [Aspergillus tanneri]THC92008.1 hypothetical protein EYZ11_008507 [Aspergillus tanneri]
MSTTSASPAAPTCAGFWELPTKDVACALPNNGNASDILDKCCKRASVTKYDDGCGIYCLAQEQSAKDLTNCFREQGAIDGHFFCSGGNASHTASAPLPSKTGDHDSDSSTGTSTGSKSTSTSSDSAAVLNQPVSKSGLGLLAVLVCSALMGVVA